MPSSGRHLSSQKWRDFGSYCHSLEFENCILYNMIVNGLRRLMSMGGQRGSEYIVWKYDDNDAF